MVFHAIAWDCSAMHIIALHRMASYHIGIVSYGGIALYCMVLHVIALYCMVCNCTYGIAWYCTEQIKMRSWFGTQMPKCLLHEFKLCFP